MKYAIYDKVTDGYLIKMEFEVGYSEHTRFECGLNEYITEAKLLDTPKEAADTIARIESFKFMDKGRFVMHSFDDTLNDQYIISEAGEPTKVVDNITVDLEGTIDVKYGSMASHWSTAFLEYAINRMNALQKAKSPKYTAWCNTFDIYKVITVIDERSCTHYQFIKVTEKGLAEYVKDEVDPLNKRIEELEKANYDLGQQSLARGLQANRLKEENDDIKIKVEAIKKQAQSWKHLYEKAYRDREVLMNVIDNIYDDLGSTDIRNGLKETYDYVKSLSELNYIKIHNDDTADGTPIYISAMSAFKYIIDQMVVIMEGLELNQSVAFASADEVHNARNVAYDIISICEEDSKFEITLEKFSQLHEAMNAAYNTDDDPILHAFNSVLLILTAVDRKLTEYFDEIASWKNKAQKAEKALDDQKKLNDANKATIAQMVIVKRDMNKEIKELRDTRGSLAEVIFAIRNAICNNNSDAFRCINNRMIYDPDFNSDPFMAGVRENIKDVCTAEKRNIANYDLKNSEISKLTKERDKALERAEKFKGIANSVYGMTIPGRCCGKQITADVITGKKILVDKEKYDNLVEYVANINLTYDTVFCMMDKPVYLSTITESLNDLTK